MIDLFVFMFYALLFPFMCCFCNSHNTSGVFTLVYLDTAAVKTETVQFAYQARFCFCRKETGSCGLLLR